MYWILSPSFRREASVENCCEKLIENGYLSLPHHVSPGQGVSLYYHTKIIQASKSTKLGLLSVA